MAAGKQNILLLLDIAKNINILKNAYVQKTKISKNTKINKGGVNFGKKKR